MQILYIYILKKYLTTSLSLVILAFSYKYYKI